MTHAVGQTDAFARLRARNRLIRQLRDEFRGHGLDIRERNTDLVISSPGQADKGNIHIRLATGDVSHRRTLWAYLGHLPGHGDGDQPDVDVQAIIALLTQPDTP